MIKIVKILELTKKKLQLDSKHSKLVRCYFNNWNKKNNNLFDINCSNKNEENEKKKL